MDQFGSCLDVARRVVPDNRKNRTKISLAGTGGMRLLQLVFFVVVVVLLFVFFFNLIFLFLPSENTQELSNQVLNIVRDYFRTSGFLFTNDSQVII